MIIGITGSIGSGKTAAAKLFSKHHFNKIDADEMGHNLIKENKELKNRLVETFGTRIADKNGDVDRKKLGGIVFNGKNELKKLNSIMHPLIINEIKNKIKKIQKECGADAKIIIDAPLLIETKLKNYVDRIVVVKTDMRKIFERIGERAETSSPRMSHKNFSKDEIERILNEQMPLEEKLKYADFVIDNNRDFKNLEKQVKDIVNCTNFVT